MKIELVDVRKLKYDPKNARKHSPANLKTIAASLKEFKQQKPVIALKDGTVIAGNGMLEAARKLGWKQIAVKRFEDEAKARAYAIADNRSAELSYWDDAALLESLKAIQADEFDLTAVGFNLDDIQGLEKIGSGSNGPNLATRFGVPPFSVLDARQGYWRTRKAEWLALGIQSELGRKGNLLGMSNTMLEPDPKKRSQMVVAEFEGGNAFSGKGTSIFDPVLCELVYRWFCPKAGKVFDPFAGGSVRGIVAAKLGLEYLGVDLRSEQVQANQAQAKKLKLGGNAAWEAGDAAKFSPGGRKFDLLFSCPPYFDLEQYSDDKADLSNMNWAQFRASYQHIILKSSQALSSNSFACFVVGDVRDEKGYYRNFVGETVQAFEAAGMKFYNDAILITSAGAVPLRAGRTFDISRKLGKTHQNVLAFYKGDLAKIKGRFGSTEFGKLDGDDVRI